ncbi:MAG: beta-ketoacyl-ACP synthase III [Sphingomonadales bacterium]|jgi:3-oxoacyl-[acyl-carrier-protein] synthase-3
MTVIRSHLVGCGAYLPKNRVSNDELAERVDTSDEWIQERTGIKQRHIAAEGEMTSDLALKAAQGALKDASMDAQDIDLVIVATTTPDQTFPAVATKVQAALGIHHGAAFDVQAVCSGFIYGLSIADNFIKAGQAKNILVIGAETFSRLLDWEDRTTCVLFGDGAGAVVLSASEGEGTSEDRGILTTILHSDGRYNDLLKTDGGPSSTGSTGYVRMKGREVFKHAVVNLANAVKEALDDTGLTAEDVDWVVAHQANRRILEATAKKLKLDDDKVIITVDEHANTSAASIPLALYEGIKQGRITRGDVVLMEAMGGGFTWGSALVRL